MNSYIKPRHESPPYVFQKYIYICLSIEEHQICFRFVNYSMTDVSAAARYYRGDFRLCLTGSARHVMVPGGRMFHLEPRTIQPCWNLLVPDVLDDHWKS